MKKIIASFDVDAQKGFTPICPNELPVNEGDKIVNALNENAFLATIRVGSKDAHPPKPFWQATEETPQFTPVNGEHKNLDIHWNQHCTVGSLGFELLDGLPLPEDYDFFVWKGIENNMHPYGACYHDLQNKMSTGVIEFLKSKNVDIVIVGGLATDYCVLNTVMQLRNAGFEVVLNKESCRGISEDTTLEALKYMDNAGVKIVNTIKEFSYE